MRLLVIDNYDSFTYNLVHLIGALGPDMDVVRNDKIDVETIRETAPEAIILSPGPCTPNEAGVCVPAIAALHADIPIFGVCLGMQSMAAALGGNVVHAPNLMHGKVSKISHQGQGVFRGINQDFSATRYHSLMVDETTLPEVFETTAHSADDNVLMGIQHRTSPLHGVQFHPESIASDAGAQLMRNFLDIATSFNTAKR